MNDSLPFSQACENNKAPILQHLTTLLEDRSRLLEVGGGTGQHAVFFAESLTHLHWQSTDIPSNVDSLNLRIAQAAMPNLPLASALDVNDTQWNVGKFDAVFTANSIHIMSAASVERFFSTLPNHLESGALLIIYGPFRYAGEFTTESNERFDGWLKARDPLSGVRDFEWVDELAQQAGLKLKADHSMPANNQLLVWDKVS